MNRQAAVCSIAKRYREWTVISALFHKITNFVCDLCPVYVTRTGRLGEIYQWAHLQYYGEQGFPVAQTVTPVWGYGKLTYQHSFIQRWQVHARYHCEFSAAANSTSSSGSSITFCYPLEGNSIHTASEQFTGVKSLNKNYASVCSQDLDISPWELPSCLSQSIEKVKLGCQLQPACQRHVSVSCMVVDKYYWREGDIRNQDKK